jgi:choline kinase
VHVVPIGTVDWVEVDDQADLERARAIECRY